MKIKNIIKLNKKFPQCDLTTETENFYIKAGNKYILVHNSPALFCWSHINGYPDNSIALKGFVNGPKNALSSNEEIDAKYGDRPDMAAKLKLGLQLAKYIPAGEAWQGDCLFSHNDIKEEEINGTKYLTFMPNKIVYAFSEDNADYNKVKNCDFGIAFHTIYKVNNGEISQGFDVDPTKVDAPENFYIMSPAIDASNNQDDYDIDNIKVEYEKLRKFETTLIESSEYEELINNPVFMNYWNTFENATLADKKQVNINVNTFINDLKNYVKDKQDKEYQKKLSTLKTDKGRQSAEEKYNRDVEELANIIENNKSTLTNLVNALNSAANIKMMMWDGLKKAKNDYSTFYKSRTKGYIPAEGEGIAMSDMDGNIVKIVDRSTFSSYNRDPDIMSGFEHEGLEMSSTQRADMGSFKKFSKKLTLDEDGSRKGAVLAFGRLNPPTIGHEKLIDTLANVARANGYDPMLFLSHSSSDPKNPLSYESKVRWCKKAFGDKVDVVNTNAINVFQALKELYDKGYTDIIYVGGSDRIGGKEDMTNTIKKYNNSKTKAGETLYSFNTINFVNAGIRDDDSDDLTQRASASLARKHVIDDDFEAFKEIVPFNNDDAYSLFKELKYALKGRTEEMINNGKTLHESVFGSNDISKHNYFNDVIDYILDNKSIALGARGETVVDLHDFLTPEKENELRGIYNKNNASMFNDVMNGSGVKWNKIFKGHFSGHAAGQQSVGEGAEPVIAYMYNHGVSDDSTIRSKLDDEGWLDSSRKIVEFINSIWPSSDYVAVHVNGNDLEPVGEYGKIGSIFRSKEDAAKILGLDKAALANLYSQGKDNWNKADIVLVKKDNIIKQALNGVNDSSSLNDALRKLAKDQLIPISLKKINPNKDLKLVPEGFENDDVLNANVVNVLMPIAKLDDSNNCSVHLIDDHNRRIQFRRQSDTEDNLSIEANLGTARGGKSIGKLKKLLGISGNDWYSKPIQSGEELMNYLRNNFNNVSNPSKLVTSHDSGKYAWYNRTCFRGLRSLFNLYKEKYNGDCNSFFDWIYSNSTTGSGAFYLIVNK